MKDIGDKINALTSNEDLRQDLWVAYLSGAPSDTFSSELKKIRQKLDSVEEVKIASQLLIQQPLSKKAQDIIAKFSDVECRVMCYLALGMSIDFISKYNNISRIRVLQLISTIKNSCEWKDYFNGP